MPHTINSIETFRDLVAAYRLPRVMLTALELDLFTAMGTKAWPIAALAYKLKVSERGLDILCRNLAVCGLLRKRGKLYRASRFAATVLNARHQAYRGAYLDLLKSQWQDWSRLTEAKERGLTHVTFRTGDVTALPFEGGSFDAVISRFCLMFLPEIPKAIAEIVRVLKPGGYVSAAVWAGPDKNPYLRIPMDIIKTIIPLPPPDPEAPGIFRLARPGDLAGMYGRAGLTGVCEEEFTAEVTFATAEEFLRSLMDVAAPIQNLFAKLTPDQRTQAEQGIISAVNDHRRPQGIVLPIAVRLVGGRKAG